MNIQDTIADLVIEHGEDKAVIKGHLLIAGFKEAQINTALKDAGLTRTATNFRSEYQDWLLEEPRTRAEAEAYIMHPNNSNNTHKHLSHYLNIHDFAERVRKQVEAEQAA